MKTRLVAKNALVLSILLLLSLYFSKALIAQDTFHTFTNKEGKEIEAQLVSITPDLKRANIKIKGRNEVPVEIVTLSLDDQQYLKNWLKKNPIKQTYNLDFTFTKNIAEIEKVPVPNYDLKFVTEKTNFKIEIKNRTRVNLTGATLEYYIITEHSVGWGIPSNPLAEGMNWWMWPYDYFAGMGKAKRKKRPEKPITLRNGKTQIEDLPYNNSAVIMTDPVPVREIINARNRAKNKDTILGVIVRITDENGSELIVQRSSEHEFLKRSWDEISNLPPGNPTGLLPREQNN